MESLALRNKKEVEGRRDREREKILPKKKGVGSKGKFEWFLCTRKKVGERQTTVWTSQGGDTLVTSSTYFPSFTRLSNKSPPLPNARHEGTRMWAIVHRHCAAGLLVHDASIKGKPWRLVCLYGSNSGLMMRFGKVSLTKLMVTILGQRRTELYLLFLLPAENRTLPEQTHVSLPSVHSSLLHDLEEKVSSSTSWTCPGQLLRQCSTTLSSLRRKSTRYSSTKTSKGSCQSLFERRSQCVLSNMTPEARQLLTSQSMT